MAIGIGILSTIALLAVAMVAILKIVSDHIDVLRPFGEFLGA